MAEDVRPKSDFNLGRHQNQPTLEPSEELMLNDGRVTALIDEGAFFEGRLAFEGVVRIGGSFKGEIFTNDTLVIDPGAIVEATIEADTVIISGEVTGDVSARSRVIMHPPAWFRGNVNTPSLRIDEGVTFEGASTMPKDSAVSAQTTSQID